MDQGCRRREAHFQPCLACRQPKSQSNVRLTGSRWAEGNSVFPATHPVTSGQIHGQGFVQAGHDIEVKAIQALRVGKLRRLDAPFNHPLFAINQLHHTQSGQMVDVIFALGRTELCVFGVFSLERWQTQRLTLPALRACTGDLANPVRLSLLGFII